jgi:HEAT repeat protein
MTPHAELVAVACLLGGYAVWNLGMFIITWIRSIKWHQREKVSRQIQPKIHQELIEYVAGREADPALRELSRMYPRDFADTLLQFQGAVSGAALERLCDLTIEYALIHTWCEEARSRDAVKRRTAFARLAFVCVYEPCRRVAGDLLAHALSDKDNEVRFHAWRWLAQRGNIKEIEQLFDLALDQPLLIRILLTEELRRFAIPLCERAVIRALYSDDSARVLAALEMLVAWERAVPVPDLHKLIESRDRQIRIQALRLAPLVHLEEPEFAAMIHVLLGEDLESAAAAATALGRIRFEDSMAGLARCLRSGHAVLARAAAEALAEMPPKGWATLEEFTGLPDPIGAGASAEALSRAHRKARV